MEPVVAEVLELEVEPESAGQRLDVYLAARLEYSRSLLQDWIRDARVVLGGKPAKSSTKVKANQQVLVEVPPLEPADPLPDPTIPLSVVYEDDSILVINKQRGLVVHPAIGNPDGTLVNALLAHETVWSGIRGVQKPGIVHRLDKNTTGLMVTAKNDRAHVGLQNQFRDRSVLKIYRALVHGVPSPRQGRIHQPIGRHVVDRTRMAVVPTGKPAISDYKVLEVFEGDYAYVEVHIHTGRTHQIRVHMAWLGHQIVGDPMYGRRQNPFGLVGQALHCYRLGFVHPTRGDSLEFTCDVPEDFQCILDRLRR
ncbi:MAG: RluA family pseudouridine synthase [Candidatus Eremiobacteraeota bacterium]|nr:RluA family pseudouridine synthase [Candidatus Eremiobacteraeota bacterium]